MFLFPLCPDLIQLLNVLFVHVLCKHRTETQQSGKSDTALLFPPILLPCDSCMSGLWFAWDSQEYELGTGGAQLLLGFFFVAMY